MIKKIWLKILVIILFALLIAGFYYSKTLIRLYQGFQLNQTSKERAKYYTLQNDTQIQDITDKLISDKSIPDDLKQPLISGERRIVIFKYHSGSDYVAGYFSYLVNGNHPAVLFLRGGNGFFGIMRPNNRFSFLKGYNVVGTLYRGNIYGGKDDFGGKDIQDVENLIKYFPKLTNFTHTQLEAPFSMIGVSRGAMEMFAALSRSTYVKTKINRAISISGNVDLQVSMNNRPEMKYLFINQFKHSEEKNFEEWIKARNPVDNVKYLPVSLKVLLIYGLSDNRVSLEEQKNFKRALDKQCISAQLVTISGANHGMDDHFDHVEETVIKFIK